VSPELRAFLPGTFSVDTAGAVRLRMFAADAAGAESDYAVVDLNADTVRIMYEQSLAHQVSGAAGLGPAVVKATRETGAGASRPLFHLEMTGSRNRGLGQDYEYKHLTLPRAVIIAGSALGNSAVARELIDTALSQGWARASVGGSQSAMLPRG
jgi:hypothetical protein